MSNKYFGTDGIRGTVNQGNITGEKFFKFGLAAATYFKNQKKTKQIAIIAKDTRLSGYTLEPALVSGLASGGMHVFTLGPLPTNGLAMLTKSMKANMGIMISASHNPYYDNGLKLFGPDGMKLSDQIEKKIWNIWSTHPTQVNLTQSLAKGSDFMLRGELETAYKIFSTIIDSAPDWAEGWNKRATVLYLMGRYHDSLNDIDEVLKRESRHFGALSGQGLVQTELKNYEKAIKSYQAVQKIYPSIRAAKVMIPQLRKLIKEEAI